MGGLSKGRNSIQMERRDKTDKFSTTVLMELLIGKRRLIRHRALIVNLGQAKLIEIKKRTSQMNLALSNKNTLQVKEGS